MPSGQIRDRAPVLQATSEQRSEGTDDLRARVPPSRLYYGAPGSLKRLMWSIRDSRYRVRDMQGTHCSWTLTFDRRD